MWDMPWITMDDYRRLAGMPTDKENASMIQTVGQLIARLREFDPSAPVGISDSYGAAIAVEISNVETESTIVVINGSAYPMGNDDKEEE